MDDVEIWPSITHIYVGMYLLCTSIPNNLKELLNDKSLDCYINLVSGQVREVLVKTICAKDSLL